MKCPILIIVVIVVLGYASSSCDKQTERVDVKINGQRILEIGHYLTDTMDVTHVKLTNLCLTNDSVTIVVDDTEVRCSRSQYMKCSNMSTYKSMIMFDMLSDDAERAAISLMRQFDESSWARKSTGKYNEWLFNHQEIPAGLSVTVTDLYGTEMSSVVLTLFSTTHAD